MWKSNRLFHQFALGATLQFVQPDSITDTYVKSDINLYLVTELPSSIQ